MPYPWPSFGSFRFQRSEQPIFGTDLGWTRRPTVSRSRPLGTATDNIVTMAIGSADRSFEAYFDPLRLATLEGLVNTAALFTDWENPDPDSRQAFLARIRVLETVMVQCEDGATRKRTRTLVELVSQ